MNFCNCLALCYQLTRFFNCRWKLVEIDADLSTLDLESKHVMSLINPANTYMVQSFFQQIVQFFLVLYMFYFKVPLNQISGLIMLCCSNLYMFPDIMGGHHRYT